MPEFEQSSKAAKRFAEAGAKVSALQRNSSTDVAGLNAKLVEADRALLLESGLPGRPWFRHAIYAPGKHAGYAAAVIPGVNDSIDDKDFSALQKQLRALTSSLERAASILEEAADKH